MNKASKNSKTRNHNNNNKQHNKETRSKHQKTRSKHHKRRLIQQLRIFDFYLKDIEKLRGLDNETVYKIVKGGDWFTDSAITTYNITTLISTVVSSIFNNSIFQACLDFLKNTAISIFELLKGFIQTLKNIIEEIWKHGTNSKWFWFMIKLVSIGLFDWITVGFFSGSGLGQLMFSFNMDIANFFTVQNGLSNFNMFYFIFNILGLVFSTIGTVFIDFISVLIPYYSGNWIVSIMWTLVCGTGLVAWFELGRGEATKNKSNSTTTPAPAGAPSGAPAGAPGAPGHAGGDKKKASTFTLRNIPSSKIAEMEKEKSLELSMAQLSGYIKTNEKGEYYFTEQADKTLNVLLDTSVSVIKENCKEEDCREATPVDKMNAFQFIHIAHIHAISRKNTEEKIGGKKYSNVVKYLKKEDIEWIGEKYPEQLKSAERLGLVVDNKLTKSACGVIKQSDTINGKKITAPIKKLHSSKLSASSSESS